MNASEVVLNLFRTIEKNNREDILACFLEDAVFHNLPMAPARGHDEIWNALAPIHDICQGIEWQVLNIAEDEAGRVLTERLDRYQINDNWCEFPVMGILELENGKVKHWRDYFDLNQTMDQIVKASS
jgi:limonene-1,2-epoxide hydrolase